MKLVVSLATYSLICVKILRCKDQFLQFLLADWWETYKKTFEKDAFEICKFLQHKHFKQRTMDKTLCTFTCTLQHLCKYLREKYSKMLDCKSYDFRTVSHRASPIRKPKACEQVNNKTTVTTASYCPVGKLCSMGEIFSIL